MAIKFFLKKNCDKCVYAKEKTRHLAEQIAFFDVETRDGLAESMLYDVQALPAIIVTGADDEEVMAWRGGEHHTQPLLAFLKKLEQRCAAAPATA